MCPTLRVVYGGEQVAFAVPRKGESLLAFLLLNSHAALTRDVVAFTLWPDETEGTARANLRRHIHLVTRSLPQVPLEESWILSGMKRIQWNPNMPAWVDVANLLEVCADEDARAVQFDRFEIDMLRGIDDDWLTPMRERLRSAFGSAMLRVARKARLDGDFEGAIHAAQRLIERDPLREDAVRELIMSRYQAGDRAGALRDYWRFRTDLQTELGVAPDRATTALFEAVLSDRGLQRFEGRDFPLEPPKLSLAVAPEPTSLRVATKRPGPKMQHTTAKRKQRPFIGRERDLELLLDRLERAREGEFRTVIIEGGAGLGKSRLLSELHDRSKHLVTVVGTQCFRYAQAPLAPLIDILSRVHAADPALLQDAQGLSEQLQGLIPSSTPHGQSAALPTDRQAQFSAIAEALRRFSARKTLLLSIEDIHWADLSTLECLCYLARKLERSPVLIVLTYRPESVERRHPMVPILSQLLRERLLETITIGPLSDAEIRLLIEQSDEISGGLSQSAERIVALAEGNPLFAGELAKHAANGRTSSTAAAPGLPLTLKSAVLVNFDEFDDDGRTLLTQAAILGRTFDSRLLAAVANSEAKMVNNVLRRARDLQLVVASRDSAPRYVFRHALLQEILYEELLPDEAQALHARAARVLEALGDASVPVAELAHHWARADNPELAARYGRLAGDAAMRLFAYRDAIGFYRQAQRFTAGDANRAALEEQIADAELGAGEFDAASRSLDRVLDYYEKIAPPERRATLFLKLSSARWGALEPREALTWAQRAVEETEAIPSHPARFAALIRLGRAAIMRADAAKGLEYLARAAAGGDAAVSPALRLAHLIYRGLAHGLVGEGDKALADFAEGQALLEDVDDAQTHQIYHQNLGVVAAWYGEIETALAGYEAAAENGRRTLNPAFESSALASAAYVHVFAGDLLTARGYIDTALRVAGAERTFATVWITGVGITLALRLQDELLLQQLEAVDILEAGLQSDDATFVSIISAAYIEYFASRGEIGRLKKLVRETVSRAGCGANVLYLMEHAALYGDEAEVAKVEELLLRWALPPVNRTGRGVLCLYRALVARRFGKRGALRQAKEACAFFEGTNLRYHLALALEAARQPEAAIRIHRAMHNRRDAERVSRTLM